MQKSIKTPWNHGQRENRNIIGMWYGKFFDKEELIDTPHTLYTRDKISVKDYIMWFELNNRTHIYILTPVGETETATLYNGIGQGSFAAALASSIMIGCAVYDNTLGQFTSNKAQCH